MNNNCGVLATDNLKPETRNLKLEIEKPTLPKQISTLNFVSRFSRRCQE